MSSELELWREIQNVKRILDVLRTQERTGYKKYVALLRQTGTNAPTATVLENTFSGTPTYSRSSAGSYAVTLANQFPEFKTFVITGSGSLSGQAFISSYNSYDSVIGIYTSDLAGTLIDGELYDTAIEIRVYP